MADKIVLTGKYTQTVSVTPVVTVQTTVTAPTVTVSQTESRRGNVRLLEKSTADASGESGVGAEDDPSPDPHP